MTSSLSSKNFLKLVFLPKYCGTQSQLEKIKPASLQFNCMSFRNTGALWECVKLLYSESTQVWFVCNEEKKELSVQLSTHTSPVCLTCKVLNHLKRTVLSDMFKLSCFLSLFWLVRCTPRTIKFWLSFTINVLNWLHFSDLIRCESSECLQRFVVCHCTNYTFMGETSRHALSKYKCRTRQNKT